MADVGSVVSHTTKASSVKPPPAARNPPAATEAPTEEVRVSPTSRCSSLTASVRSQHSVGKQSSRHSTTVTAKIRKQIEDVEAELLKERRDREEATRRIRETQQQLDALEQLLKLKP